MTASSGNKSGGPWIIAALVVLLLILHQDIWFWNDDTLILGFLPIGLFWHVLISIGASLTWALATVIAWPIDDEQAVIAEAEAAGDQTGGADSMEGHS